MKEKNVRKNFVRTQHYFILYSSRFSKDDKKKLTSTINLIETLYWHRLKSVETKQTKRKISKNE